MLGMDLVGKIEACVLNCRVSAGHRKELSARQYVSWSFIFGLRDVAV